MIVFTLPIPPSVNALYPGKVRRYKSDAYKAWLKEAWAALLPEKSKITKVTAPCSVTYRLGFFSDKRRRDLCNREKALSDFLVAEEVLEDDCLIHRLVMEWADDVPEGLVEVIIVPAAEDCRT